jgi:hypothetical protein
MDKVNRREMLGTAGALSGAAIGLAVTANPLSASPDDTADTKGGKKDEKELTKDERENLGRLKDHHDKIIDGFNKVLQDNGITLYVKHYALVPDKKKTERLAKWDGPCCCWCGVYLQDCSLCNNFCGPKPPK